MASAIQSLPETSAVRTAIISAVAEGICLMLSLLLIIRRDGCARGRRVWIPPEFDKQGGE